MRIRVGGVVLGLALAATVGVVAGCTPTKLVPNAGVLRRADGTLVLLVVPCRDHRVTDVVLSGPVDGGGSAPTAATAAAHSSGWWWIDAPRDPARPLKSAVVGPVEVVPFEVPPGWTVTHSELEAPMRSGVRYEVRGFMQGRYDHHATGPEFRLADLDRLRRGMVYAEPDRRGAKPVAMSRADFERRASRAC